MIKDLRHIRTKLYDIEKLIRLMHETLEVAEDSPEVMALLEADIAILAELILRLQDELNS